jgi:SAM-dependent methyltransferase
MPLSAADVYSALYDSPPDEELEFVRWVAEIYGIRPGSCVLDVGCGTGRLLPGLAAMGWRVVGYEPNPQYAAAARALVAGVQGVEVVTGGFLDLDDDQAFDLICAINDPFAYLGSPADRRQALRRVRRALVDDGLLVIDNPNFLWILSHYRAPEPADLEIAGRPAHHEARHEIDVHHAVFRHTDRVTLADVNQQVIEDEHVFAITSYPELAALLEDAGLRVVAVLNSTGDRVPTERLDGPRMVIIARALSD